MKVESYFIKQKLLTKKFRIKNNTLFKSQLK